MLVATPTEAKKAKILRQYADSRIDLNLDSDEKSEFLSKPLSKRRNSVRKGSIFVSHSKSPRHRQVDLLYAPNIQNSTLLNGWIQKEDDRISDPDSILLPLPGRRKSRRYSTVQGLGLAAGPSHGLGESQSQVCMMSMGNIDERGIVLLMTQHWHRHSFIIVNGQQTPNHALGICFGYKFQRFLWCVESL